MKFELADNELSTPEGLKEACKRARIFVEENIPGEHRPFGGMYWWVSRNGNRALGCACAFGYLSTALDGYLRENVEVRSIVDQIEPLGLDFNSGVAFISGFDAVFDRSGHPTLTASEAWNKAGRELAQEWSAGQLQENTVQ